MLDPQHKYSIYRSDRQSNKIGGGVCVFVLSTLQSHEPFISDSCQQSISDSGSELVCVDLNHHNCKIRLVTIYRPPNSAFNISERKIQMSLLTSALRFLLNNHHTTVILGDFNLPNLFQGNDFNFKHSDNAIDIFYDSILEFGLSQFVSQPTHFSPLTNNILDLIFSSDPNSIQITAYPPPLSTSDHCQIQFFVSSPLPSHLPPSYSPPIHNTNPPIPILLPSYDWSQADFNSINNHLSSIDWHTIFGYHFDPDSIWAKFKSVLWSIIDLYVPKHLISHNIKHKPRSYPKQIRLLLSRKAAIWRMHKRTQTETSKSKYASITNQCKQAITKFDIDKENKILQANNLGAFYRFVNSKTSNPSGIPPLLDPTGNLLTTDVDKANLLNSFLTSTFTTDDGSLPHFPPRLQPPSDFSIHNINISPPIVARALSKLKSNSAPGPDQLPSLFFKNTSSRIAFPLSILFRSFFDLHQLPTEWKHAIITPKFKKGSKSLPSNYRPIALTCTCSKIMESIISTQLIEFLHLHNLINPHQHAFLKRHSTTTNLLDSLNDWTFSFTNNHSSAIAYIDFHRAFDVISHPKLIHKLNSYGIKGDLLFWITAFLTSRTQSVRVGHVLSSTSQVSSGVPQGSVLGPLLFILFINDISDSFHNSISYKLFADDVKIYTKLSLPLDTTLFQQHLDIIHQWSSTWQLPISYSKCHLLILRPRSITLTTIPLNISGTTLTQLHSISDLGVTIDQNLNFKEHLNNIISKAKQRSYLIHKSFLSRNPSSLLLAYKTYVRPLLEYASTTWSPSQIGSIDSLERVQRQFTKRLIGYYDLPYADRLSKLGLQSLEHRRLLSDLVTCYNIIHGATSLVFQSFFTFSPSISTRGHHLRLSIPLSKTNTSKFFFSHRVIPPWNSLPTAVVSAPSTHAFKRHLTALDLSKFLIFPSYYPTHPTPHSTPA